MASTCFTTALRVAAARMPLILPAPNPPYFVTSPPSVWLEAPRSAAA